MCNALLDDMSMSSYVLLSSADPWGGGHPEQEEVEEGAEEVWQAQKEQ